MLILSTLSHGQRLTPIDEFNYPAEKELGKPWVLFGSEDRPICRKDQPGNNGYITWGPTNDADGEKKEHAGASLPITVIPTKSIYTYFFRVRADTDSPNHSFGLSSKKKPINFDSLETQILLHTYEGSLSLFTRDGADLKVAFSDIEQGKWYNIWMVVNMHNKSYDVYLTSDHKGKATMDDMIARDQRFRNGYMDLLSFQMIATSYGTNEAYGASIDDLYHVPKKFLANPSK
ncbi:hypothetical protein JIN82_16355 [Persicirhabdus sediminis]|uniref:Uncharacterized protein n=2 Tax=Persicirhabdus sediminis TaxID=454144 RepID=A0A8J7MGZ0_9BACT|nr:hypothetical protein [Persicirhabdus sediminis]